MTLSRKERVRRALCHEPIDHLPTQINYTQAMEEKLVVNFGVSAEDLPKRLNNHLLRVDIALPPHLSEDGTIAYDWWGVGFDPHEEGYFTKYNPLADSKDLDSFPWPDPHNPDLLRDAAHRIQADSGDHFVIPNFGFALFERAWSLRGFDTFLMDMAIDPGFAEELLERITDIQMVLIHQCVAVGVDGGYFGDDYGAQKNLLFSPKTWRTMIKPRLARMFAPFREAGLPVLMHSDGDIAKILPDLVEIGLTTYNPIQPEVVGHVWLKDTFGGQLAYYGGISTQTVLPKGTPGDVKQALKDCIHTLAPDGTGLLVAPSHRMMADIPLDNVEALLDGFRAL